MLGLETGDVERAPPGRGRDVLPGRARRAARRGGPPARRGTAGRRRGGSAAGADRPARRLRLFRPGRGRRLPPCRRRGRPARPRRGDRAVAPCRVPRHRRAARRRRSARRSARCRSTASAGDARAAAGRRCSPTSRTGASTRSRSSCRSCSARSGATASRSCRSWSATPRARRSRRALEPFADDPGTLVVVSSDLSHFLGYEAAVRRDRATAGAIERLDGDPIGPRTPAGTCRSAAGWRWRGGGAGRRAARLAEQRRHGGRGPAERRRLRRLGILAQLGGRGRPPAFDPMSRDGCYEGATP